MSGLSGLSQRVPPSNIEAEQALLGALLANNQAFDRVAGFLRAEHFADPLHGELFETIRRRVEVGRVADAVSLRSEWENRRVEVTGAGGKSEVISGADYLANLFTAMVGIINAGEYGRAIRDAWHRRALIEIGENLVNRAFGDGSGEDAKAVHEATEAALFALAESGETGEAIAQAHEAMALAIDAADRNSRLDGGLVGLTTGLRELDDLTGGWRPGSMNVVAARPSMGKTQLGLKFATAAAAIGSRVLFGSLEMTRQQLGASMTAGLAEVARDIAERGKMRSRDAHGRFVWTPMTPGDAAAMMRAQRAMVNQHLLIDELRSGTMSELRARCRREKRRGGLDLVVIDYIGRMRVPELARSDNRVLEITRLSSELKALARDLDVPVIVLSQLNRGSEARENKRPALSDLRDSGAIEQDADVVIFPYREEYHLSKDKVVRKPGEADDKYFTRVDEHDRALAASRGRAELIVDKNRLGATGTRVVAWRGEQTWFHDFEGVSE